jgi:hypothetical protein
MLLFGCRWLPAIALLVAWLGVNATAQVRFVQLTDPHLFDKTKEEMSQNEEALLDAVSKINELEAENGKCDFVVVTGDIGIEQLVSLNDIEMTNKAIKEAATKLGDILAYSNVKVWLFVPGNNDLVKEDPDTIGYYRDFIKALSLDVAPEGIKIVDLCAPEPSPDVPYVVNKDYVFIGFNNASFKNDNEGCRVAWKRENGCREKNKNLRKNDPELLASIQKDEIKKVAVSMEKGKFAYIFYHIPEVDDPYLVSKKTGDRKLYGFLKVRKRNPEITDGEQHKYSSWFVRPDVWRTWQNVANDSRVKELFAGHLHAPDRKLYENYFKDKFPKLNLCPPLAIKLQATAPIQARGLCEVSIDEGNNVREGKITNAAIYWYDQATWLFSMSPPQKEKRMTWETAAQISTVFQFIVVAASLFFIWKQLKQQTDLARLANTQAQVALVSPFNLEMAQNREMARLWTIGADEWDKLSQEEKEQYGSMLRWWFIFYENIFFQAERGLLDDSIFTAWKQDIDAFVEEQLVEKSWSKVRQKYHNKFVCYMDKRVAEKKAGRDGAS